METYTLKRRVGEDGILRIEVPVDVSEAEVEVVVVVQAIQQNEPEYSQPKEKSSKYERANEPWSNDEEQTVLKMHHAGAPVIAIARRLKRSRGAINARMKKLGLLEDQ